MRFLYRLCLELGYPSPRHLLRELTSEEVTYWRAYAAMEPFGAVRMDELLGMLMAQNYNMNRSKEQEVVHWHDLVFNAESPKFEELANKAREKMRGKTLEEIKAERDKVNKQAEAFVTIAKAWNERWAAAVAAGATPPKLSRKKKRKGK